MVQVYFLLVALNILSGLILARGGFKKAFAVWDEFLRPFDHRIVKGILGVLTFLTGFLGLIFVLPGDQIFLGDLIPSVCALLSGTILGMEFYQKDDPEPGVGPHPVEDFLLNNKIIVGLMALTLGFIHFFAPTVIFL